MVDRLLTKSCTADNNDQDDDDNKKKKKKKNNNNKRPRGLDTLLGHLLVKRIPAMYKLSRTKIPEYSSQK